jgi:site-specific recombinase XerD
MSSRSNDHGLPELLCAANCKPLRRAWHALRHTFASHYIMSGGNILALQKILGHSDLKMTLVYSHLAPEFLAHEMERVRFGTARR